MRRKQTIPTAMPNLRQFAERLRSGEFDREPGDREQAADMLVQVADKLDAAYSRSATWLARSGLAGAAAALGMLVAGIWVDWRWAVTAVVALAVAGALLGMSHVARGGSGG